MYLVRLWCFSLRRNWLLLRLQAACSEDGRLPPVHRALQVGFILVDLFSQFFFMQSLLSFLKMKRCQPCCLCVSHYFPPPFKVQDVAAAHLPRRPFEHVQLQEHLLLWDCARVQGNSTQHTELVFLSLKCEFPPSLSLSSCRITWFASRRGSLRVWGTWVRCAFASASPAPFTWSTPTPCRVSAILFKRPCSGCFLKV